MWWGPSVQKVRMHVERVQTLVKIKIVLSCDSDLKYNYYTSVIKTHRGLLTINLHAGKSRGCRHYVFGFSIRPSHSCEHDFSGITCFGFHFMPVLEKQEKYDGRQQFFTIVQLIGTGKQVTWPERPRRAPSTRALRRAIMNSDCLVFVFSVLWSRRRYRIHQASTERVSYFIYQRGHPRGRFCCVFFEYGERTSA